MSNETQVIQALNASYPLVQQALRREYADRYPRVCGPCCIVLPRSQWLRSTGVPLKYDGHGERFELEIGIYNPASRSSSPPDDHTHLRYYTGTGYILYIDPMHPLLWGDAQHSEGPIIERYHEQEIDQALAERYALFPFSEKLVNKLGIDLWSDGSGIPPSPQKDYDDLRAILHDDRALIDGFTTNSGDVRKIDNWGQRTTRVLKAVDAAFWNQRKTQESG